ncbi:RagB/SusD family nutrient uptake outer membrane protein [Fulvivirga ligni]|uniref:RagB/SusD family nutrient uptake outer membrane protein n=1 Tax=Fulvivirga ligni TaxID=2904246 RepID=UPI001F45EA01|nr:RagB/SusD family nutrient uptake outer membrane protein [Fulvivirga ligni]UII21461.1 RagB/SusD family nutrient uptake outer membrane protein [Fulvivirga ligni]
MKNKLIISYLTIALFILDGCNDYLDIVPDNVAEIDMAFRLRNTAERFLFTCYSYMPAHGGQDNPAFHAGDELWLAPNNGNYGWQIALGAQEVVDQYCNFWGGTRGGKDLYEGIRQCNIFLENVNEVPDLTEVERKRWIGEAKFLKAYYHFYLIRMYGPIVLKKENVPVSASPDEVRAARSPIDACFDYVVQLLDEAEEGLPEVITNKVDELGRITKAIELSVKAQVLVTAASPLFNGNPDYQGFSNSDGTLLFNPSYDAAKWQKAAEACKVAIDFCEAQGIQLYEYAPFSQYNLSDTTIQKLTIRNAVCEKWNSEVIWGNTNSMGNYDLQSRAIPRGLDPAKTTNSSLRGNMAPPIKIAEMFYSSHGVPINEDVTYDFSGRFQLKEGDASHKFYLKEGYSTAALNFDREPRYYADLGFDGGIWYGQGVFDDNSADVYYVQAKWGQPAATRDNTSGVLYYSSTGYWPKKLVHFESTIGEGNNFSIENYPWPVIRLADMYLLYAEALNEVNGPTEEVYTYLNKVRERAGIPSVQESWSNYSNNPGKFTTQAGLRSIIHTERNIELAFEGKRFWDLRRWKEALVELNQPITGWNLTQPEAEDYYKESLVYSQSFTTRDYFWPLNEYALIVNNKLVQNPGW